MGAILPPSGVARARPRRAPFLAALALLAAFGSPAPARAVGGPVKVDVELMLAVDVSRSMDVDEQRLQREGYVAALRSQEFAEALKGGAQGRVAVAYMEWAGAGDQWVVLPFTLIDGPAAARDFADKLAAAPIGRISRTSISRAIEASVAQFEGNGFDGLRRVIDISGDGPNNAGPMVTLARDAALAKGYVINGLPIMLKRPTAARWGEIEDLDVYYEDCVVGGPGAFSLPIREVGEFLTATRKKLVLEIAARQPAPRLIPASAQEPRVDCMIGERMWRRNWDN
jgi:hypothetical protein